jgi:hypothetical protein
MILISWSDPQKHWTLLVCGLNMGAPPSATHAPRLTENFISVDPTQGLGDFAEFIQQKVEY